MKKLVLLVVVITSLVLSACAVPAQNVPVEAAPAQPAAPQTVENVQPAAVPPQQVQQPAPRTISVNGTGQVTLSPDVAYVYIGVRSQSENVSEALSENNEKAQAISAALTGLGIDAKDIQTSGFNVYPQEQYSPEGQVTSRLYNVENTVYVTVRNLQGLGNLLDVVVRTGANSINGITFDVLDKSSALSEARRLAIESARSQAEEIAQAAGVTLGEVQNLNVYSSSPVVPMDGRGGMAMDAAQVPISAGQMILRVEVNAVYVIR